MYRPNQRADDSGENGHLQLRWNWRKIQGGFSLHEMYMADTQERTDLKDTNRPLLRYWKNKSFRVNGNLFWRRLCGPAVG